MEIKDMMTLEQLCKELNILKAQGHGKAIISLSVTVVDNEQHGPVTRVTPVISDLTNLIIIESA